jgi:hypothetical protein
MTQSTTIPKTHYSATVRYTLLLAMVFLFQLPTFAQGWEKVFGGNSFDQGNTVIQAIDRGYLIVGFSESFPDGADQDVDIYVIKTDVDGTKIWEKTYDPGFTEFGKAAVQTEDLGFVIAGEVSPDNVDGPFQAYLLKISDEGTEEWDFIYDNEEAVSIRINDLTATTDGGFLLIGSAELIDGSRDVFLLKVDQDGNESWRKMLGNTQDGIGRAVTTYKDGYIIVGSHDTPIPPPTAFGSDAIVYYVDQNGDIIWQRFIEHIEDESANTVIETLDGNLVLAGYVGTDLALWKFDEQGNMLWERIDDVYGNGDEINSLIQLPKDSTLVIAGSTELNAIDVNFLIGKLTKDGDPLWYKDTGDFENADVANSIFPTQEGGFIIAGHNSLWLEAINSVVLTLTDANGDIYTSYLKGKVFYDQDGGCDLDPGEQSFEDWLVRAESDDQTFFGSTDANGNYLIAVDTGTYKVEAIPINGNWISCQPNGVNILIDNFYDSTTIDFPIQAQVLGCPLMEVDISTPFLSPCSDVTYTVDYINNGTGDADNAFIEVTLGDSINFVDASIPWTVNNEVYTFQIGNVPFNSSGSFTIQTFMACTGIANGQAGMVTAHILPDTVCTPIDPDWDMSSIKVTGRCLPNTDSVEFTIQNIGVEDMTQEKNAFIIEDDLVVFLEQYQLPSQAEMIRVVQADGATMRMVAEQSEGHPGNSLPTVAIEGCANDGDEVSFGFVTDWPEDDIDPSVSIHVDEFITAQEEVTLVAHPRGYQDSIIAANTSITYRFLFRNIGTDTVARIVIRDTLSTHLDLSSIEIGASSHPFDLEVYHTGVIKITFNDIKLPNESTPMDPNAFGFIELKIAQQPDNPIGTVIENQAYVIFDYYAPVQTNTTRHIIEAASLDALITEVLPMDLINGLPDWVPDYSIKAYPNPMTDYLILEVEGWTTNRPLELSVYNTSGQLVKRDVFNDNQYILPRANLSVGSYFYSLSSEGQIVGGGTLIVR